MVFHNDFHFDIGNPGPHTIGKSIQLIQGRA